MRSKVVAKGSLDEVVTYETEQHPQRVKSKVKPLHGPGLTWAAKARVGTVRTSATVGSWSSQRGLGRRLVCSSLSGATAEPYRPP